MTPDLRDKVALITGGGSGIDLACAEALAAAGAEVALCGRTENKLTAAAAAIEEATGRAPLTVTADVARKDEVEALVAATVERFGRLDYLVNNAGVFARGRVTHLRRCQATNPRFRWPSPPLAASLVARIQPVCELLAPCHRRRCLTEKRGFVA